MLPFKYVSRPSIYLDKNSKPIKHYGSFFEIDIANDPIMNIFCSIGPIFSNQNCYGHNTYGETVSISLPKDNNLNIKAGVTLAILYSKFDEPNHPSIHVDNANACYVFNSSLFDLIKQAMLLLDDADLKSEKKTRKCFECGSSTSKLSQCGSCHLAQYCSKECQIKNWSSHRKLCPQSEILLRFACLPRHSFEKDLFSFRQTIDDSSEYRLPLPSYVYHSNQVQKAVNPPKVFGVLTNRLNR